MEIKKESYDFLMYAVFGLTSNENDTSVIARLCANKAYRDFNRTLIFKKQLQMTKEETSAMIYVKASPTK